MTDVQKKYHPDKWVSHSQYMGGMIEAMTQLEAIRLAMQKTPLEKLKPADVLQNGFYKIKNLDTGGISEHADHLRPGEDRGRRFRPRRPVAER